MFRWKRLEKRMSKDFLYIIEKKLFLVIGILIVMTLILAGMSKNIRVGAENDMGYRVVSDVTCERYERADTPTGFVNEYRFTLGELKHADTLAFYMNHHNIEVYLEDTCVYRLETGTDSVKTTGGIWTFIPLYERDMGKEVRVELIPLYKDYQDKMPDFLIGSEMEIYQAHFKQALPELVLSFSTVLAGLFLLSIAVYYSIRKVQVFRLYAIGMLAVSAGIWRFTYGRFAYMLFAAHPVLAYVISVIALMLVALSMLNCVELPEKCKWRKFIQYLSISYCLVYAGQLVLQLAGIFDLRQMLTATHITIVISAVVLCCSGIFTWYKNRSVKFFERNYLWILGIGVIIDLLLYYINDNSVGMLCTLGAILGFSVLEGIGMLNFYTEQQKTLEEMETKLALSRTTTMMSQIRSHFVFNILNAISGMCKYDPEKADDTVVRFARYLRNNIDIMEDDKNIPFTTDLRQLEDYVTLEQVRFGDKIEFYTDIEADQFMIPPLILQPVVENAIKHGVSKKMENGTIILRTREVEDEIVITIEDDGVGFDEKELDKEKSVGLKNIRFRLEHLVNGTLDIKSEVGKGTTVWIKIPKKGD